MRLLLCTLAVVLTVAGCSSSREASSARGYTITENKDGTTTISVSPDDEGALAAALIAMAAQVGFNTEPWIPPDRVGRLEQIGVREFGPANIGYRYRFPPGRFDVYVYSHDRGVEGQLEETEQALATLIEQGQIDAFTRGGQMQREVPWRDATATLHRVQFEEKIGGKPWDSFLYLLEDGAYWVKVRVSFTQGAVAPADLDAMVEELLAG